MSTTERRSADFEATLEMIGRLSIAELKMVADELQNQLEEKVEDGRRSLMERFTAEAFALGLSVEEALGEHKTRGRRRRRKQNDLINLSEPVE